MMCARTGRASRVWLVALVAACGGGSEAAVPSLSVDGLGEVHIGMTVGEVVEVLGESPDPIGEPECAYLDPDALPAGVMLMVVHDTIARIDVMEAGVRTAAGIGVGSTEADVRSAYGEVERQPHKYTDGSYLVVPSADGSRRLLFETDGAAVTAFRAGRMPEVQWVEGCA